LRLLSALKTLDKYSGDFLGVDCVFFDTPTTSSYMRECKVLMPYGIQEQQVVNLHYHHPIKDMPSHARLHLSSAAHNNNIE